MSVKYDDVSCSSLLCLYGGMLYLDDAARSNRELSCDHNTTLSQEIRDRCMKYRKILFNRADYIDIPEEVDSDDFFRATVGHKVSISTKFCGMLWLGNTRMTNKPTYWVGESE